ncbi:MAG: prepilin-type N-terminal cleavage/methylation domain-containing protein [Planctomycetes bacterium]|nr:prepilin-type N-terminal cleavage/methylation domain-containing protein [Planctomycetota bacterium]
MHPKSSHASRSAFTLLELVIAVTIMAILAAAAVPAVSTVLGYQMRKSTREELSVLSQACGEYFRDTSTFPTSLAALSVDPTVAGWAGPYLPGELIDPISGLSSYEVDAWSRSYRLTTSGDVLTTASAGDDAVFGSDDDISIELNVTWIRREVTLERLKVINQAIVLYNGVYQITQPLSANYASIYSTLVTNGFLPASTDFQVDAWGDAFVPDPVGVTPVVRVGSSNLGS